MTPRAFCTSGVAEATKAGVHGAAFMLGAIMTVYNVTAWIFRHERHLAVNAVLYASFTGLEWYQGRRHLTRR